eukprot:TRINITY_DN20525_c0_g1_i2.p2 TRINITY_DN20525_c0_g1~~TRINITY_DN20525_c0_g1_i2.p2  ORF type:complete len:171 (+),score=36.49 TRINITY_DN20525_c0_g1_i2:75-587(+)
MRLCAIGALAVCLATAGACRPEKCLVIAHGTPAATKEAEAYRECVRGAGDTRAFICACTGLMWECLSGPAGCPTGDGDAVNEAGLWCEKYVARQGLQCAAQLCGRQSPRAGGPHRAGLHSKHTDSAFTFGALLLVMFMCFLCCGGGFEPQVLQRPRHGGPVLPAERFKDR